MKKYILLLGALLVVALLVCPVSAVWYPGEAYGINISLSGQSSWPGDISNYDLLLNVIRSAGTNSGNTLYVGTNCNANYSDFRFTDISNNTLPYWIEDGYTSSQATIWVNVTKIYKSSSTTITAYYGNTSFQPVSNGNTTWQVYDHFDGASINATKWTTSGNVSVSGSQVTLGSTSSWISSTSTLGYSNTIIVFNSTRTSGAFGYNLYGETTGNSYFSGSYFNYGSGYYTLDGSNAGSFNRMILKRCYFGANTYGDYYSVNSNTLNGVYYEQPAYYNSVPGFSISSIGTPTIVVNYIAAGNACTDPTMSESNTTPSVANFTSNVTYGNAPLTVQFNDTSSGTPDHWWWSFGDGNVSTIQNATNKYYTPGLYNVTLTVQQYGINGTITKTNYISAGQSPTASFSVNKTTGTAPITIGFTDTSTNGPIWWNWSYGDGGANGTTQNPMHTYTSSGSYQVILTAGNSNGNSSATQTLNFQQAYNTTGYGNQYATQALTIHVTSPFGTPLVGVVVTMQGTSSSTGSLDYIAGILGFSRTATPIDTTLMSQTTDMTGNVQFMVLPTVSYSLNVIQNGTTLYTTSIVPTYTYLVLPVQWNIYSNTGGSDINGVYSFTVTNTTINSTAQGIVITGVDTKNHLTGGTLYINQTNTTSPGSPENTIYSQYLPAGNFSITYPVSNYAGQSYFVRINATQSDVGRIKRDFGITFPVSTVNPMGLDAYTLMLVSIGILFLCGAIFTTTTAAPGTLITCFVGWVLYGLGWLALGGTTVLTGLIAATVISVLINIIAWRWGI